MEIEESSSRPPGEAAATNQEALSWSAVFLKGAGQVMFCDKPLSGVLFLLGVAWGALQASQPAVLLGAVLGLLVSTLSGLWLKVEQEVLRSGLCGYNGLLVGAALATFLAPGGTLWTLIVMASIASTVSLMASANIARKFSLPALTFPFVICTWAVLLAGYDMVHISLAQPVAPHLQQQVSEDYLLGLDLTFWLGALLKGVSQVFLIENAITGLLFLAALAVAAVPYAALALLGSLIGLVSAAALGADHSAVGHGLWGFNPVLTALALGAVFRTPSARAIGVAAFAALVTAVAQGAMQHVMMPFKVPVLTMPFVLVTWMFLSSADESRR